jgi:hypothetical protein
MIAWEEEMPLPVALWLPSPGKKDFLNLIHLQFISQKAVPHPLLGKQFYVHKLLM